MLFRSNVQNLFRILPPLEFKSFLRTAASAIIDSLKSHDVYVTYRGDGEFVGVIPRKGQTVLKVLGDEIAIAIEESEGKHTAKLPATATLVFAAASSIRIPTRGELNKAIWDAVERVRAKTAPLAQQNPKRRMGRGVPAAISRLRQQTEVVEEDLRAEFTQLLREQLKSEVGEHRKPSRTRTKKAPPSVFKKRQANGKNGAVRKPLEALPPTKRKKKESPAAPQAGEPMGTIADETPELPISQHELKSLRYSNG